MESPRIWQCWLQEERIIGGLRVTRCYGGVLGLTKTKMNERNELRSQIEHLLSLEEISWRQKSRMLCIKEGDNNTKFFHKMANSHRRYNHLSFLEVDEVIYEEEANVAAQVVQFYKTLYQESEEWRPFVEGLEFDQIEEAERGWMERRFEKDEIIQVVRNMEGDKAPGLDGFFMAFFQHYWRVVESDVSVVLKSSISTVSLRNL